MSSRRTGGKRWLDLGLGTGLGLVALSLVFTTLTALLLALVEWRLSG